MRSKVALLASIFMILLGLAWISSSVQAAPAGLQVAYPSPTPQPNGQIIYIVKAGETCTQISILYGVSIDYLRNTNQLDENCTLREGQKLQLGTGGPSAASPTPGPSPIPTLVLPSPTPIAGGKAEVCVLVFDDVNGDGLRQTAEVAIAGAAISLTSLDGTYSQTLTSVINPDPAAYQGICFPAVPMGKYNVSAAAPVGYNPTINLTSTVEVTAGDIIYIDYGAQEKTAPGADVPQNKPSSLLGLIGAAFLLAGIGMAIYVWSLMRRK
jgi:hypothetical protein